MSETVTIATRFHGPPSSGNGGYTCGRLGTFIDGPAAVRLKVPPPLETSMSIVREGEVVRLMNGDQVVGEARPATVDFEPPPGPAWEEAEAGKQASRKPENHYYPTCFVCGPSRGEGDGLRILPGPVPGREFVASTWIPDASLDDGTGSVAPEFLWAALDCPGGMSFTPPQTGAILLGELTVDLRGSVEIGERCIVLGWEIEHQGRKHFTGTAVYNKEGACVGVGRGVWIEVAEPAP